MARPKKTRVIKGIPGVTYFKPRGIPLKLLKEVCLSHDEFEAIKIYYVNNLQQIDAAKKMGISQPTFARTICCANKKIANALVNGLAIKIEI
jgi:predicted DNA-binding protein (UPF0251 family)